MARTLRSSCANCCLINAHEVNYKRGTENRVFVVGQSPARVEVDQNEVFSGESGKLLKKVMRVAGVPPETVTLANALRCQEGIPGLAGKKLTTAMKACRINLEEAIAAVTPNLIVVMGANALKTILNKGNVSQNRGKFFRSEEFRCDVFVMIHPAAVMRGSTPEYPNKDCEVMTPLERTFLNDWVTVKQYLDGGCVIPTSEDVRIYRKATKETLLSYLDADIVSFDIETTGLNFRSEDNSILSIGFCKEAGISDVVTASTWNPELWDIARQILENKNISKIVAARPFDENFLRSKGFEVNGTIHDVLVIAHLKDENYHSFSLENVASIYAGMHNIKDVAEGFRANLSAASEDLLIRYNGIDADATFRVYKALEDITKTDYYRHFIIPVTNMLSEVSNHGCRVNTLTLDENVQTAERQLEELATEFISIIPERVVDNHRTKGLSLSRNAFVRDALFSKEGLRIKPEEGFLTETTKDPQLTEEHLKIIVGRYESAALTGLGVNRREALKKLMKWKKLNKVVTSYLRTLPEYLDTTNSVSRIYPNTSLTRTVTGRTVMLNPPIQTYPARGENADLIRSVFVADPNHYLMAYDLSQSELKIMGWLSGDKGIMNALRNGIDLHTLTVCEVLGTPLDGVTKEQRTLAKGINFGLIYGMQALNFKEYLRDNYDIHLTITECTTIRNDFFRRYSGIQKYHDSVKNWVKCNGYVTSPLGRIRHLPGIFSPDLKDRAESERQAINSPIQSFSSDLGLLTMMLLHGYIKTKGDLINKVKLFWFIHDAVILQCHESVVEEINDRIHKIVGENVKNYIKLFFKVDVDYPITCEVKIGRRWSDMEKWSDWSNSKLDGTGIIL